MANQLSPSPPPPLVPPLFQEPPTPHHVLFTEKPKNLPPEPLPSPDDIEGSTEIIKELSTRRTCRVGQSFVAKWGPVVEPVEGYNMLFVRENTNVSVPRLFAIYQRALSEETNMTYLVMEYVKGESLDTLWARLDTSEKMRIAKQLKEEFNNLRKAPSYGYYGSLGKSKVLDGLFWTAEPSEEMNGPFTSEGDLINGMLKKYLHDHGERMQHRADYYHHILPKVLQGSGSPVFTHNDLQRKNVILRPDKMVCIVNWAESGWYPSYWEYSSAVFACGAWLDDWHVYMAEILEEYPNQNIWLSTIRHELWGRWLATGKYGYDNSW